MPNKRIANLQIKQPVLITGHKFTRLLVLGYAGHSKWHCICDCGTYQRAETAKLNSGQIKSCGCLRRVCHITHGHNRNRSQTSELSSYRSAKQRCENPKSQYYEIYGKRGIQFRFNSFEEFFSEIGLKPSLNHTLERIDTNGHYEKGNVKWATTTEQARNRRNNVYLTAGGKTQLLIEWAEEKSISYNTLKRRRLRGWCDECAVNFSLGNTCTHRK